MLLWILRFKGENKKINVHCTLHNAHADDEKACGPANGGGGGRSATIQIVPQLYTADDVPTSIFRGLTERSHERLSRALRAVRAGGIVGRRPRETAAGRRASEFQNWIISSVAVTVPRSRMYI